MVKVEEGPNAKKDSKVVELEVHEAATTVMDAHDHEGDDGEE
jgi:hypothetical protein